MARKDENLSPEEEQLKQLKEDQKAFKREQKNQKKEAKKRAKELENQQRELDEQIDGTNASVVVVTLFIIAIWLGILCLLVKMDVGGFGSNVLTPILKDVPVINKILPSESGTETTKDKAYGGYNSIKDAVEEINNLQKQMETLQNNNTSYSEQIEALKAEVQRLQTFEDNQVDFQRIKEQFYEEVVFSDQAPDIDEYKKYYESIDPATAEALYKQVVEQQQGDEELEKYVSMYSSMKPKQAAAIFDTMTNDLKLVAKILKAMDADASSSILGAMNSDTAAKLTKIMEPTE